MGGGSEQAGPRLGWQLVYIWAYRSTGRWRASEGAFSEGRGGGKGSSFPAGAKNLQEEGEDVDDV